MDASAVAGVGPGAGGVPDPTRMRFFGATVAGDDYRGPVDLEFGPGGDLFYVDLVPGSPTGGTVQRIRYLGPVAQASVDDPDPPLNAPVQFSSAGSSNPGGGPLDYAWDLDGDGAFDDSTEASPSYTYTTEDNRTVRLRVTAAGRETVSAPVVVRPGNSRPVATIDAPDASRKWAAGQTVSFVGSTSDADETLGPSSMSWSVLLQHCPAACHVHPVQSFAGVASGSFAMPDHDLPYYLDLTLTVTDARGAADTKTVKLDPTVRLRVQSDPPGVPLTLEGASSSEPLERTLKTGTSSAVSAPESYGDLRFAGWSDGGGASHSLTPMQDTTLVARYVAPAALPPGSPPVVDRTPPRLSVSAKRSQRALRTGVVRLAALCKNEPCTVGTTGSLKIGKRTAGAKARSKSRLALAGKRVILKAPLPKKALKAARRAAAGRRAVSLVVSVTARDTAGNATTVKKKVQLVR